MLLYASAGVVVDEIVHVDVHDYVVVIVCVYDIVDVLVIVDEIVHVHDYVVVIVLVGPMAVWLHPKIYFWVC